MDNLVIIITIIVILLICVFIFNSRIARNDNLHPRVKEKLLESIGEGTPKAGSQSKITAIKRQKLSPEDERLVREMERKLEKRISPETISPINNDYETYLSYSDDRRDVDALMGEEIDIEKFRRNECRDMIQKEEMRYDNYEASSRKIPVNTEHYHSSKGSNVKLNNIIPHVHCGMKCTDTGEVEI